ncbi:MAG: hypothetical protein J1G38_03275 [Clostridiales bacterium]|nr:hypothetical protein [Clostridiales bacterium]
MSETSDNNISENEKSGQAEPPLKKSAKQVLDEYYMRLYNKYKEKYENGSTSR